MTTKNSTAYSRLQGKNFFRPSLFACVLTAGLFTACSSDDDGNAIEAEPQAPRLITVEVSETPLAEEGAEAREGETRGDIITTESLNSFDMHGIYNGNNYTYSASKSNSNWTLTPNLWPSEAGDNDVIPFYAHTGGTFYLNGGNPYVNYTINETASDQQDLLIAQTTAKYNNNDGLPGNVNLHFQHVCAVVDFYVQMTSKLKNLINSNGLRVKDILLRNVYNNGKYDYITKWNSVGYSMVQGQEKKTVYTLDNRTDGILVGLELTALTSNSLFVIPQTREENGIEGIYLDLSYSLDGGVNWKTANIPFGVEWMAGYKYTINIQLGTKYIKL